jgi:membrane protein
MAAVLDRIPSWRVGSVDVGGVVKETAREVGDDDVPGLAAEMAYHSVLAVFPFLLFLAGVTSLIDNLFPVGDLTGRIVEKAQRVMPDDAASVIESFTAEVVQSDGGYAIVFGLAGALWAASSAIGSAMKALNRAYDVREERRFVHRKAIAVGLTLLFTAMLMTSAGLLAVGPLVAGGIGGPLGWRSEFVLLWNLGTPLGALVLIVFAVTMLYWLGPNTDHQLKWITPGATLFVVGWLAAALLFAYYVGNFASYNRTYGSIGAVIILLVWLYWTNLLLLVGGELNAVLARRHDAEHQRDRWSEPPPREGTPASP